MVFYIVIVKHLHVVAAQTVTSQLHHHIREKSKPVVLYAYTYYVCRRLREQHGDNTQDPIPKHATVVINKPDTKVIKQL